MKGKKSSILPLAVPAVCLAAALVADANANRLFALLGGEVIWDSLTVFQRILSALVWIASAWLLSRALNGLVVGPYMRRKTGAPLPGIVANTVTVLVFIVAGFGAFHFVFERGVGGLLATSGVLTVIIGFAIREMIADYFAGIAINFEQPYQIGDWVELENGVAGQVVEVNWRATRLVTQSKLSVVVPNSELAGRHFINYSHPTRVFRESIEVVLTHTTDPERALNILHAAVLSTDGLVEGANHDVKITGFDERGVNYAVRFWIDDFAKRVPLRDQVARHILQHLNHAGIVMAVSQGEVFLAKRRPRRQERRIDHRRLISRVSWLEALTESEHDVLSEQAIGREFSKGEVIVRQDDEGNSLYVLVEGTLQASVKSDRGESIIGRIQPGEAFGEMSLLTGESRRATVTALTGAYALEVRRDDLEPILKARPEIARELGRLMAERQLATERANSGDEPASDTEMGNRALLIARRISQFFGLRGVHF